jgi:hypothetical protein
MDRRQAKSGALPRSFVVKNGSKILRCVSVDIPVPVSVTRNDA